MSSSTGEIHTTKDAISKMVSAKHFSSTEQLLVDVSFAQHPQAQLPDNNRHEVWLCDAGNDSVRALLINSARSSLYDAFRGSSSAVAMICGYVTSEANGYCGSPPFLAVTALEVVQVKEEENNRSNDTSARRDFRLTHGHREGGKIPIFLSKIAPFLTNEALAGYAFPKGSTPSFISSTSSSNQESNRMDKLTGFLNHHKLHANTMQTLHSSNDVNDNDIATPTKTYMTVLREFQAAQLDRQKVSLTSNAGREDLLRAEKIVKQHSEAMDAALACANQNLTVEMLCQWHGILCGDGIHPEAGVLRKRNVRVGSTSFRPHPHVASDVQQVCQSLRTLESRLACPKQGLAIATFAAAVLMGILDVHPFADGNGRLARLATNWALRKAGIPFVIHLFATPGQRSEYVTAIQQTRRNTCLVERGNVSHESLLAAFQSAGALRPLVDLILDRLLKAVTEFEKLVEEKTLLVSEEAEARAARKFRERAAAGNCLICFDESPNIATLCCGKAVHLNCMAEWLSSRSSCPQCRGELPPLPSHMRPPAPDEEDTEDQLESDETTSSTVSTNSDAMIDTSDTTTDTTPDEGVEDHTTAEIAEENDSDDTDSEIAEENDSDNTTSEMAEENDADTTTDGMTNTDDTTSSYQQPSASNHLPPFCSRSNCRNRSARGCSNSLCGRCCVSHGQYQCERHNIV